MVGGGVRCLREISCFHYFTNVENFLLSREAHHERCVCSMKKETLLIKLIKHNIIKYLENNSSCDTFNNRDIRVGVYFGVMLIRCKYEYGKFISSN